MARYKPSRDQVAKLRGLAPQKGYAAEPSIMTYHVHLYDPAGNLVLAPGNSKNWTVPEAINFLKRLPDAE